MKQATGVIVWRRFLTWRGTRRVWSRWRPQFAVEDVRVARDYSPGFQIRRLLKDSDEKYARIWSEEIKRGNRPLGQSWRITRC